MNIQEKTREAVRNDFDLRFLEDSWNQTARIGHNPRNYIGRNAGHNQSRASEMFVLAVMAGRT